MGWRRYRLAGGSYRGNRRDTMAKLHSHPPLLQPLLEHAGNVKPEAIGEHDAGLGFRIHSRDQPAIFGLILGGKLLKLSGRLVEPRCIERPYYLRDEGIVRRSFGMVYRVECSSIAAPAVRGVVCRHRHKRYAAERRTRQCGEP